MQQNFNLKEAQRQLIAAISTAFSGWSSTRISQISLQRARYFIGRVRKRDDAYIRAAGRVRGVCNEDEIQEVINIYSRVESPQKATERMQARALNAYMTARGFDEDRVTLFLDPGKVKLLIDKYRNSLWSGHLFGDFDFKTYINGFANTIGYTPRQPIPKEDDFDAVLDTTRGEPWTLREFTGFRDEFKVVDTRLSTKEALCS